jgi:Flp pilus assembly protein CpaB
MKNYIPLVLAVLLGLAAVLAVGRLIRGQNKAAEETCLVTAVARDVKAGETLSMDAMMKKEIPVSARPAQATAWSMAPQMVGQKVWRQITSGDYVLMTDLEPSRTMVGEGEWAITLNMGNDGIAALVQPGDEIAIIGTFGLSRKVTSTDLSAPARDEQKEATMVLFPRVRVLATGGRKGGEGSGELILGLKPQEAQILIAAQQKFKLTLALRRPGDETAINRLDVGMVDSESFNKLLNGMESVTLSAKPGMAVGVEKK